MLNEIFPCDFLFVCFYCIFFPLANSMLETIESDFAWVGLLFPQQRELMEIFNSLLSDRTPYQFTALCVHENPESIFSVTQNEFL